MSAAFLCSFRKPLVAHRGIAFLAALTAHHDGFIGMADVIEINADQLTFPQTTPVRQLVLAGVALGKAERAGMPPASR